MKVLSLFSGGGLGDYGLTLAGMEIVGQVEIDEYCQKILSLRWPKVPKWRDIRDVKGAEVIDRCGAIDLISGGFPCQDISNAGNKVGIKGKKSGLWKEMFRIVCEIRPKFVFVENVSALLIRGIGTVLGDLASIGYDAEWECIPASAVGANHRRDRLWIVSHRNLNRKSIMPVNAREIQTSDMAYPNRATKRTQSSSIQKKKGKIRGNPERYLSSRCCEILAHPQSSKCERCGRDSRGWRFEFGCGCWWTTEPKLGRVVNGRSSGMEQRRKRIHLLGNGQVPQVVCWIGKRIMEYESRTEPKL
jgi:DNA (cytosine-5)-methyltransferase 1